MNKVKEINDTIIEQKEKLLLLETENNTFLTQIENSYSELQKQIRSIYDDFIARITSGKIFTDVILNSVISAYKSGYIEFLPEYYSEEQVAARVREIEQTTSSTT